MTSAKILKRKITLSLPFSKTLAFWHISFLFNFFSVKHTCICFSMLTIKTFLTSSDHLTALGRSVSINCTQRVFPLPCSGVPYVPQTNSRVGGFFAPSVDRQGCCTKGQIRQLKWQKCDVSQLSGCEGRCIVVHSEVVREVSAALSLLHCLFYGCSHFM